jgi:hypothetical protein
MKEMKKHVSVKGLLRIIRRQFCKVPENVNCRNGISLVDCLMSGLAIFMLKSPSLLDFDEKRKDPIACHNLKTLYGVEDTPCDTYLRERLDEVVPKLLRKAFTRLFTALQRSKVLERYEYYDGRYLLSIDGTGHFYSDKIQCSSCCVKNHRDGTKSYYHQTLGAVVVHPKQKEVIPLVPEPITKGDGTTKNDCERNACKRLLQDIKREHPHLKLIVVEDGLSSNAPHIKLLKELDMRFILGAKPDDHKYLFEFVKAVKCKELEEKTPDGKIHRYRWVENIPLNDANYNCEVNFLEYWEISKDGKEQHLTWVTDIPLIPSTVGVVMQGGRSRWKIENETFNTLKNQGYHYEHNFGHGHKHLHTVFAYLMFLAFLVDQIQQLGCEFFNRALAKMKRKKYLWEKMRNLFTTYYILHRIMAKFL